MWLATFAVRGARIGKKDRPLIDPFSIQDAEVLICALHGDCGEAQGNYMASHTSVSWNLNDRAQPSVGCQGSRPSGGKLLKKLRNLGGKGGTRIDPGIMRRLEQFSGL